LRGFFGVAEEVDAHHVVRLLEGLRPRERRKRHVEPDHPSRPAVAALHVVLETAQLRLQHLRRRELLGVLQLLLSPPRSWVGRLVADL
jgi:hypothetical protein